jgi:hypothetical protein
VDSQIIVFNRVGHLWICKDLDHLRDFVPREDDDDRDAHSIKINFVHHDEEELLAAPVTQDERKLKYNARQLQKAEVAGDYLRRLGYPGPKTAATLAQFGHIKNVPMTNEGLRIRKDIVGLELPFVKGERSKQHVKAAAEIINEDLLREKKATDLFIDLFFLNKITFMLGVAYFPYCARPLYMQCHMKSKSQPHIVAAVKGFVGILRSQNVEVLCIKADQEPALAAAKREVESSLKIPVDLSTDNVGQVERGIRAVKSVCRRVKAGLPFKLFATLLVFLVAYAVARLNVWPSAQYPMKLVPRHMFTGIAPDAATIIDDSASWFS